MAERGLGAAATRAREERATMATDFMARKECGLKRSEGVREERVRRSREGEKVAVGGKTEKGGKPLPFQLVFDGASEFEEGWVIATINFETPAHRERDGETRSRQPPPPRGEIQMILRDLQLDREKERKVRE